MSSSEFDSVLAVARAHQARRRFDLTLEQLCLQQVARQEQLYILHPGHSALLEKLPPLLKSKVLGELSSMVSESQLIWRYPAGDHRMGYFLHQLINCRLETFDFAVCNSTADEDEKEIYQRLVQEAGGCLKSLTDQRGVVRHESFNLGWRLPFFAQLTKLEELKMSFACCVKGELKQLVKAAPRLKKLHLNLLDRLSPSERDSLLGLTALEELDVSLSCSDVDMHELTQMLLKKMPQLKVNCFRSLGLRHVYELRERPFHHQDKRQSVNQPYGLEHISLAYCHKFENKGQFSEVKHVLVAQDSNGPPCRYDYTKFFKQMCTLNLRFFSFGNMVVPTLRLNGAGVTTLILDCWEGHPDQPLDFYLLFNYCPRLAVLTINEGGETEDYLPNPAPGNSSLRELNLRELGVRGRGILLWVLRAPMLEKVSLLGSGWEPEALELAANALKEGRVHLANLHTFEFTYPEFDGFRRRFKAVELFVCNVLSLSPKLRRAHIDLDREKLNLKLQPLLKLINE